MECWLPQDGPKESRDAGIWVYCTLQTYVLITFRWIGSFSAGLLSPEITNIRARLVPNVCPYCPAANAFDDIDVQGQIAKVFGAQLELDPNPSESLDDVVVLVEHEEIRKTPGIDGVWGSYMSEYAPMYRYKEASNQDTIRTNMELSDSPMATLLLSVIIGMMFGVSSSWILSCALDMIYKDYVKFIDDKSRTVKTWGKLHVLSENDPDSVEQNAKSNRDSQYVHVHDQDIFGRFSGSKKVLRDDLQHYVHNTAHFTSTFFFYIELTIEWVRRSIIPPLELFICSIPMKQTLDGKLDQSAEGDGDEAHSGEDADVLKSRSNFIPLGKFKEAYYRFCSQQGLPTSSPITEKNAALLHRSGLRVVNDPFSEVYFTGIRWMQKPSQEYKRLKDKSLTNSVTVFLKNNCLATGLASDAIPLQQLAFRYKQFCYSMVLPKLQQVHITPNTPQILEFGGKAIHDVAVVEGVYEVVPDFNEHVITEHAPKKPIGEAEDVLSGCLKFGSSLASAAKDGVMFREALNGLRFLDIQNNCGLERSTCDIKQIKQRWRPIVLGPQSLLWDYLIIFLQVLFIVALPLPMEFAALHLQARDAVMYRIEPEVEIFVWSDVWQLHTIFFNDVLLRKFHYFRLVIKLVTAAVPVFYAIGFCALLSHIAGLRSWNPKVVVRRSYFARKLSQSFHGACLVVIFLYSSYLGMLATWLMLGAMLNPNRFLSYSVAVVTCITLFIERYQSALTEYSAWKEKVYELSLEALRELFMAKSDRQLASHLQTTEIANLRESMVTKFKTHAGLQGLNPSTLAFNLSCRDIESVCEQLITQPLVASLGLSHEALMAMMQGDIQEVERNVSKKLEISTMWGRAVMRGIIATCPPWNRAWPPTELLGAVAELANLAGIPEGFSCAFVRFAVAALKSNKEQLHTSCQLLIQQLSNVENHRDQQHINSGILTLDEVISSEVLESVFLLINGNLDGLVRLIERHWATSESKPLVKLLRWYVALKSSLGGAHVGKLELTHIRADLVSLSSQLLDIDKEVFRQLAKLCMTSSEPSSLAEHKRCIAELGTALKLDGSILDRADQSTLPLDAYLQAVKGSKSAQHAVQWMSPFLKETAPAKKQKKNARIRKKKNLLALSSIVHRSWIDKEHRRLPPSMSNNLAAGTILRACLLSIFTPEPSADGSIRGVDVPRTAQLSMVDLQPVVMAFHSGTVTQRCLMEVAALSLWRGSNVTALPNLARFAGIQVEKMELFSHFVALFALIERARADSGDYLRILGLRIAELGDRSRVVLAAAIDQCAPAKRMLKTVRGFEEGRSGAKKGEGDNAPAGVFETRRNLHDTFGLLDIKVLMPLCWMRRLQLLSKLTEMSEYGIVKALQQAHLSKSKTSTYQVLVRNIERDIKVIGTSLDKLLRECTQAANPTIDVSSGPLQETLVYTTPSQMRAADMLSALDSAYTSQLLSDIQLLLQPGKNAAPISQSVDTDPPGEEECTDTIVHLEPLENVPKTTDAITDDDKRNLDQEKDDKVEENATKEPKEKQSHDGNLDKESEDGDGKKEEEAENGAEDGKVQEDEKVEEAEEDEDEEVEDEEVEDEDEEVEDEEVEDEEVEDEEGDDEEGEEVELADVMDEINNLGESKSTAKSPQWAKALEMHKQKSQADTVTDLLKCTQQLLNADMEHYVSLLLAPLQSGNYDGNIKNIEEKLKSLLLKTTTEGHEIRLTPYLRIFLKACALQQHAVNNALNSRCSGSKLRLEDPPLCVAARTWQTVVNQCNKLCAESPFPHLEKNLSRTLGSYTALFTQAACAARSSDLHAIKTAFLPLVRITSTIPDAAELQLVFFMTVALGSALENSQTVRKSMELSRLRNQPQLMLSTLSLFHNDATNLTAAAEFFEAELGLVPSEMFVGLVAAVKHDSEGLGVLPSAMNLSHCLASAIVSITNYTTAARDASQIGALSHFIGLKRPQALEPLLNILQGQRGCVSHWAQKLAGSAASKKNGPQQKERMLEQEEERMLLHRADAVAAIAAGRWPIDEHHLAAMEQALLPHLHPALASCGEHGVASHVDYFTNVTQEEQETAPPVRLQVGVKLMILLGHRRNNAMQEVADKWNIAKKVADQRRQSAAERATGAESAAPHSFCDLVWEPTQVPEDFERAAEDDR
ncbi:hypothetical protein CYMTET_45292 [Cymbomonas tetramitiformis]|uniref:Uncharacterized protein n=1 Tax=Cymbomonas tetramitiformis TaxID=36881 RepID=A0AAE0EYF6_9CHLO|nr:hypothetical protein CYMTET_45292 [Cymbomonas tetramitiformis]